MPLSFLASIAENESRIRSRSMEVSLAQRLNGGLPLTPKLLGYSHDTDGKLVINPDEAPTVKLIFYMYLSGYSSAYIAKTLEELGKTTFLGNTKWTSNTVIQILRNERHCGDVLTRKTWTPDVISHKSKKNRGERQQSLYRGEHEAIVSRDDYIAVQHMINNAKYGGKSILPELRVIESGILKGFVTISPKWAGFKAADYLQASMSVYTDDTYYGQPAEGDATFEVAAGDFDLRGFEVTNASLFDANKRPYVLFQSKQIKFSTDCVRQFGKDNKVELLIHPGLRKLAVRRASKDSRQFVQWSRPDDGKYYVKEIPCSAFGETLFELLGLQAVTTTGRSVTLPAPLSDVNGAIALGCLSYLVILSGGIAGNGLKGVGSTLKEFSLPISMSFRLFGALLSGLLVTELVYYYVQLSYVLPVLVGVLFTLLHALIQAYVLTMLTALFYGEVSERPEPASGRA